jgi:hypothetical protein
MAKTSKPKPFVKLTVTPTIGAAVRAFLDNYGSHGLYEVDKVEAQLKEHGLETLLQLPLYRGWKVTKSFIKSVEASGGYCTMPIGTAMIDGEGVLDTIIRRLDVTITDGGYIGRGRNYWHKVEQLFKQLPGGSTQPAAQEG